MKRVLYGDQLDVADLIKENFIIGIVSIEANIPASGGMLFTIPSIFPNPMCLKLLREGSIEEFEDKYYTQLSTEGESTIAALLYGIIEHNKKVGLIRYFNEIKRLNLKTGEEEFVKYNFLETLKKFLIDKYDVELINMTDYVRKYTLEPEEFVLGKIRSNKLTNWEELKNKYSEILKLDAPSKDELREEEEIKANKKEIKEVIQSGHATKSENIIIREENETMSVPPSRMPVSLIKYMSDEELLEYVARHNIEDAIKAKYRVGSVLDVDRDILAQYIKYGY